MDCNLFSELKNGHVVPITYRGHPDHAFIPKPLSEMSVSPKLFPLQQEARIKIERLDGRGRSLPDARLLIRPLQRREALTSNSIEGTFVSPQELLLFEVDKQDQDDPEAAKETKNYDWAEVFAYDNVLKLGCQWINEGHELNREMIKRLHKRLMTVSPRGREKNPGDFRTAQVVVGAGRRYIPPPPEELDRLLENFERYLAAPAGNLDPLLRAYIAHYQFEAVHPFLDGNGRIGRVILALSIYKWLQLSTPCLYMSEFFDKHRKEYIDKLFRISTHGEWEEWLEFCLRGTIEQAEESIKRCDALDQIKKRYQNLLVVKGGKLALLIDDLFVKPFIRIADVKKKLGVTYKPARKYIQQLEEAGILVPMGKKRPRAFVAHEIFETAFGD